MGGGARIVGFGAVSIDQLLRVDEPFSSGKGRVVEEWQAHGGNVATALVAAASLGASAGFVGWLTDDSRDAGVAESLSERGVDVSLATRSKDARPVRSTIVIDRTGERFIAFRDDTLQGAPPALSASDFPDARYLLVDAYAAHTMAVVHDALSAGVTTIGDIEWSVGAATGELLALCRHLVLPWEFAVSTTGEESVHRMFDALWSPDREAVVVTHGAAGAWVRQKGSTAVWHQSAFPVDVLDTTGCGDWFHGAYAASLSLGRDPLESVRFAAAAAAVSAESLGGRSETVSAEAVELLLNASRSPALECVTC